MITLYLWRNNGAYTSSIELEETAAMPARSTPTKPPVVAEGETALWNGSGWSVVSFVPDVSDPEPQESVHPQFTALEMLDLFTEEEQLAVVGATMSSPAVKLWYDRLIAATFVTYEDPRTEGGLQALVDAQLITPERKAEIASAMQPETADT